MVKYIALIRFPKNVGKDETRRYWLEEHVPLIKSRLPELKKYVINMPVSLDGKEPPYDGAIELHFEDMASLQRSLSSEPWLREDRKASSAKVVDRQDGLILLYAEETVVPLNQ